MPTQSHIQWAEAKHTGTEHVSFENFVRKFNLSDRESATNDYKHLIKSKRLRETRRESLEKSFVKFQCHHEDIFWAQRKVEISRIKLQLSSDSTSNDAVVDLQEAAVKKSQEGYLGLKDRPDGQLLANHSNLPSERLRTPSWGSESSNSSTGPVPFPTHALGLLTESNATKTGGKPQTTKSSNVIESFSGDECGYDNIEFPDPTRSLVHFEVLNQATSWVCEGTDIVAIFREFRTKNLQPFSLVRDGIADLTPGSTFLEGLAPGASSAARRVATTPDIYTKWPTLQEIMKRVFVSSSYDDVSKAIKKENMEDPIAAYMFAVIMSYNHYFKFHSMIPGDLNEREGFTDLTWGFIRGALTLTGIESRHLEVQTTGVQERKNVDKDPLSDILEPGQYSDGLAFSGDNQIYLAETSLVRNPKAEKRRQDEFKLARGMRDSWVSQIRSICRESTPPRNFSVFGSATYKDETRLWQMDFQGVFRLRQFDSFLIPLEKKEFGRRMEMAVCVCLQLAARIEMEIESRANTIPASYDQRNLLSNALQKIFTTSTTPKKQRKRKDAVISKDDVPVSRKKKTLANSFTTL
ncbi:hypothetical protein BCR41DRAFT_388817 [Lobosporangium transversale]|uniref:Uncharacterized protein n=1 Tax=Lobosporangium transversale TaxID=64571 RepID=A0A1Y2GDE6_9FUNG|nr:hypothetical protein BCR41DRAFT_388817 [Lobosporangium transversale]ORZ07749.1 hypothetical protein BCR41DRAFT_388817 [Lobosporangium transversale]|eukprot:XP_021878115.1 hypothetical protein BCR41DRAFT_388817 [Lobosporangium transversale]